MSNVFTIVTTNPSEQLLRLITAARPSREDLEAFYWETASAQTIAPAKPEPKETTVASYDI
ncbi:MAG TPA: hypothetical protein VLZ12_01855 [Verrucomicrobiae bacterium]|nr:hypothetical protein [Verrucomicrobiae bacterium]